MKSGKKIAIGGNITLIGSSGAYSDATDTPYRDGIRMTADGDNARMVIRSNGGNIAITGTSGASNYANSAGVRLRTTKLDNSNTNTGEVQVVSRTGNVTLTGDVPVNTNLDSAGIRLAGTNYGKIHYLQYLVRDHPLIMRPGHVYRLAVNFEPDVAHL